MGHLAGIYSLDKQRSQARGSPVFTVPVSRTSEQRGNKFELRQGVFKYKHVLQNGQIVDWEEQGWFITLPGKEPSSRGCYASWSEAKLPPTDGWQWVRATLNDGLKQYKANIRLKEVKTVQQPHPMGPAH